MQHWSRKRFKAHCNALDAMREAVHEVTEELSESLQQMVDETHQWSTQIAEQTQEIRAMRQKPFGIRHDLDGGLA